MNVQRFTGRTNKLALEQVRTAMGSEALILSSKRTAEGVEICAMLETGLIVSAVEQARPSSESLMAGTNEIALAHLKRELIDLRETLHAALGERIWQDSAAKRPIIATVEQRLLTLGLPRPLIGELVEGIKKDAKLDDGWRQAISLLASRIEVLTDAEKIGLRVKAFIGGNGAERATATQQAVAGALREFSSKDIAVISMLSDPSSALGRYCHEQEVVSYLAPDAASLKKALTAAKSCRQVFIETPDLSPSKGSQDPALAALLNKRANIAALLVLPCTAQPEYLDLLVEHAAQLPLAGAVLTQLKEATSLGGALGILVGRELPIAGVADVDNTQIAQITAEGLISESKRLARRNLNRRNQQLKVAV